VLSENNAYPAVIDNFFNEYILTQFNNHRKTPPWITEVLNSPRPYIRQIILGQGRADFTNSFNGLSPEDKVLLYCCYYMRMHMDSLFVILSNHLDVLKKRIFSNTKKIIFVDFGCGPISSSISFSSFRHNLTEYLNKDINFICIDNSAA
jgi:DNA replication ATP-dependent helicase Dna2